MAFLRSLRRRIQRYTVFGPIGGARVAALALLHRLGGRERIVRVHAAGLAHPVHLRPGTSDVWILDQVVTKREYAIDGIAPARAIVDAGANIGLATAFFATEHPTATILAIEPEAANHALLVRNTAAYPNVVPIRGALWSERGTVALDDPGEGHESYRVGEGGATGGVVLVEALELGELLRDHGIDHVDLLKLDIEGAERAVLEHSDGWIGRVDVLAVELHDHITPGCVAAFDAVTGDFAEERRQGETVIRLRERALTAAAPEPARDRPTRVDAPRRP